MERGPLRFRLIEHCGKFAVFAVCMITAVAGSRPTIDERLQEHHIELTQPALFTALTNRDPIIRMLAAQKLVTMGDSLATARVENALVDEQDVDTRMLIAQALAVAKDEKGVQELGIIAMNKMAPPITRVNAAVHLANLKQFSGLQVVLSMTKGPDKNAQLAALSGLITFRAAAADTLPLIAAAKAQLSNIDWTVRYSTAAVLKQLNYPGVAADLASAIQVEQDDQVRLLMESLLKK